jgi:hypothetical protein
MESSVVMSDEQWVGKEHCTLDNDAGHALLETCLHIHVPGSDMEHENLESPNEKEVLLLLGRYLLEVILVIQSLQAH